MNLGLPSSLVLLIILGLLYLLLINVKGLTYLGYVTCNVANHLFSFVYEGNNFFTFTMQIIGGSSALFIDSCSVVYIATGDFLKKSVFFRNYQLW